MDAPGHMNNKNTVAQQHQIPFMLIAGEREAAEGTVAVRRRGTRDQQVMPFTEFKAMLDRLRSTRSLSLE
jgi:threonyl-tRNA synthetase